MGKIKIDGIDVEIAGNEISKKEFDYIKNLQSSGSVNPSGVSDSEIDPNTGYYNLPEVDSKIRFAVSAAPNLKSKYKTLQKFFKEVRQDEYDPENFIVTDVNNKKFILDDKSKKNLKDVIDVGKEVTQVVTSTGGAIAGTALGPVGTIAGAGAGLAGGSELYERIGQLAGTEIDRTFEEYATTRLGEFVLGSVAQTAGPVLLKGVKFVLKGGSESSIYKKAAEALPEFKGNSRKAYDSISIADKIEKGIGLNMADKLTLFNKYNVRPTFGQVTENKTIDTLETTFASIPYAAAFLRGAAEQAQNDLGEAYVRTLSKNLQMNEGILKNIKDDAVGGVIQRGLLRKAKDKLDLGDVKFGLSNKSGFFEKFKNQNQLNYSAVDLAIGVNKLGKTTLKIPITNYMNYLKIDLTSKAKTLTKIFDDKNIALLYKDMLTQQSKGNGVVPYIAVKSLRTAIGKRLGNPLILDTTPRTTYRAMYGNLSKDIKTALGGLPNKQPLTLFNKANKYFEENITIIDNVFNDIAKKVNPDDILSQLFTKSKRGATAINNMMRGLEADRQKIVVAAMVNKLGQAPISGDLAALGKTNYFNTTIFNKNYGAIEQSAKDALFKSYPELNKALREVNYVATLIERQNPFKDLGQVVTKGSAGTGLIVGAGSQAVIAGATAGAVASGNPLFLLGIPLFGYGGAYALKAMSNPTFLNWVSTGVKIAGNKGFDGVVEHLVKLGTIAGMSDDDMGELTNEYMELIKKSAENYENQSQITQPETKDNIKKSEPAMPPVNTRVTDIENRPTTNSAPMPTGDLQERITQSNQLDQFIPVR